MRVSRPQERETGNRLFGLAGGEEMFAPLTRTPPSCEPDLLGERGRCGSDAPRRRSRNIAAPGSIALGPRGTVVSDPTAWVGWKFVEFIGRHIHPSSLVVGICPTENNNSNSVTVIVSIINMRNMNTTYTFIHTQFFWLWIHFHLSLNLLMVLVLLQQFLVQ